MPHPFVHVELSTGDLDRAKTFYTSLFGWTLKDADMGGGMSYTMIHVGEGVGGGMMKSPRPGAPPLWLPYVGVEDIKEATEKARSLGAQVMHEPMQVMGAGWFSIIVDPTGAALGMWQEGA